VQAVESFALTVAVSTGVESGADHRRPRGHRRGSFRARGRGPLLSGDAGAEAVTRLAMRPTAGRGLRRGDANRRSLAFCSDSVAVAAQAPRARPGERRRLGVSGAVKRARREATPTGASGHGERRAVLAAAAEAGGRLVTSDDLEYRRVLRTSPILPPIVRSGCATMGAHPADRGRRSARCSALGARSRSTSARGSSRRRRGRERAAAASTRHPTRRSPFSRRDDRRPRVRDRRVYPPRNARLIARIDDSGAVVSEYRRAFPRCRSVPGAQPIVVGLSEALVVVEGAEGSGR